MLLCLFLIVLIPPGCSLPVLLVTITRSGWSSSVLPHTSHLTPSFLPSPLPSQVRRENLSDFSLKKLSSLFQLAHCYKLCRKVCIERLLFIFMLFCGEPSQAGQQGGGRREEEECSIVHCPVFLLSPGWPVLAVNWSLLSPPP